ncbi:MAG: hypothetical protein JW925_11330 [Syntrophaceae bacterium]|nr:hypothetical protein [Syntrophaceae bacterium]
MPNFSGEKTGKTLVAGQFCTDKNQVYLDNYERFFSDIKNENITLLELGIFRGESLLLWENYFSNGKIIGIDIKTANVPSKSGRIFEFQGYQQDTDFLDAVARECASGGFDIIIDDASHIGDISKITFWHLFDNHLKPGGIYVIEDWRTGYWDAWIDGATYKQAKESSFLRPFSHGCVEKGLIFTERNLKGGLLKQIMMSLLGKLKKSTYKHHFPSHDFGMVGFVKELIDELGMDMITNPERGSKVPQRQPKFKRMEIGPGQVFIIKNM